MKFEDSLSFKPNYVSGQKVSFVLNYVIGEYMPKLLPFLAISDGGF